MALKKIRKGNLLFDKEKVKKYKEQGDVQNNKEEFILNICSSFYYLIDSRFKPRENYPLTHDNKLNGKGIQFFMEEGQPIVYAGGFQNGQFQGKGKFILVNRIDKGHFENGTRHGHIFMDMVDGSQASGQYVNGVQEGLWKIKLSNGATFEKVFKNEEIESSTPTNTGVKNTQIAKYVEDAQYQLKSSKRYINEIVDIANGCSDRTTLRSYQVCLRPLKRKIDLFTVGIVATDRELAKAIKEADRIGCTQALQILKNAEDDLWEANGKFGEAYKAVTETYHATTVSNVRAEFRKCKAALQKATKAMDEYYFWINSLTTQTCYEYSNTDNSTLPSRTSSKSKASSNNSSSSSSKKITTSQESSTVTSGAVVYPAITSKYEGNNLLLLMGRKLDDPAVQRLFNDAAFQFKESTTAIPKGQRMFYATKDNCSVTFKNGIIYELVLSQDYFDKNEYFKNKLPLDIPLAKPLGRMKSIKGDWKLTKYGSIHTYKLSKYKLYFKVSSDVDKDGLISKVQINAYDIKDWNSYYRQFQ